MSEEETKVAFGMVGFWAGLLLGFSLFGFPLHASHFVEHVSTQPPAAVTGKLPSISLPEMCDAAESRQPCSVP